MDLEREENAVSPTEPKTGFVDTGPMLGSRTLGAVLLNPSTGQGEQTLRHLRFAQQALRCESLVVANLFPVASRDMWAISDLGREADSWLPAREEIIRLLDDSDEIVVAWGVSRIPGPAHGHFLDQTDWVRTRARERGLRIWTMGGRPRHPSRWHQYVSDVHQRTSGGTIASRIAESLVENT